MISLTNLLVNPEKINELERYINSGGSINLQNKEPGIFKAITANNIDAIEIILNHNMNHLEIQNGWSDYPIHHAIRNKNEPLIRLILDYDKSQILKKNGNKFQALHLAVEQSSENIIEYLINELNAPKDVCYFRSSTTLDLAILNNDVHIEYLLDNSIFDSSENFEPLLNLIDNRDSVMMLNFMIRNGFDINKPLDDGESFFDKSLSLDISPFLKSLLENISLTECISHENLDLISL